MSERASATPPGLTLLQRDDSIETVTTRALRLRLLSFADGAEVLEGRLKKGEFITLISTEDAVETYYLVEGNVSYQHEGRKRTLQPGDTLVARALHKPFIVSAETNARFLCFTTRPIFHEISNNVQELMRLAVDIEVKDGYTADHCRRLRSLAYEVGKRLGLSAHRLYLLNYAAYLHDVGKIKVPLAILQKPGKLTEAQWREIKKHPTYGRQLLETTFMHELGPIVEQHHERLNGGGYPFGLRGDAICTEAAIIAVVDTYDALTTTRPYRRAVPPEEALNIITGHAGELFAAAVVEAFVDVIQGLRS